MEIANLREANHGLEHVGEAHQQRMYDSQHIALLLTNDSFISLTASKNQSCDNEKNASVTVSVNRTCLRTLAKSVSPPPKSHTGSSCGLVSRGVQTQDIEHAYGNIYKHSFPSKRGAAFYHPTHTDFLHCRFRSASHESGECPKIMEDPILSDSACTTDLSETRAQKGLINVGQDDRKRYSALRLVGGAEVTQTSDAESDQQMKARRSSQADWLDSEEPPLPPPPMTAKTRVSTDGNSPTTPFIIKSEPRSSSSNGPDWHIFDQESLDLDDIGDRIHTPRKGNKLFNVLRKERSWGNRAVSVGLSRGNIYPAHAEEGKGCHMENGIPHFL